jgi:D-amino-acid dehydrogenase
MHVVVIGAGIIGCATAYQLLREGHTVELLDAAAEAGRVSSYANGAQLSYSYVEPLASAKTLLSLPKMLLEKDAALRVMPQCDWRQWVWGLKFLRACTPSQAARGTQTLLRLAGLSRTTLMDWLNAEDWQIDWIENGKLVLCRDAATLASQRAQVALQAKLGSRQEILTRTECIAREPALQATVDPFIGGVWTPTECVADPYKLCQGLVKSIQQRGGQLHLNTRVLSFSKRHGTVTAVKTNRGGFEGDAWVLAAGVACVPLAAQLGIDLPIYPIKGYSVTLPVIQPNRLARCSITDLALKTVFAPLGDRLRVAAAAELVGHDLTVSKARVEQMVRAVRRWFPGACDDSRPETWAGLRPATPTSIPIIGASRVPNVYVNAGHGALGLTLAAGSAAQLVAGMKA